MAIPLSYSYRNLLARRLTSFLTAAGMALVVFVFAAALMLTEGLRRTLVATGSRDNAVILRAGSETEVQSVIDRSQAAIILASPEIAHAADGRLGAAEAIVLINLPKRLTGRPANIMIRGPSSRPRWRCAGRCGSGKGAGSGPAATSWWWASRWRNASRTPP